MNHANQSNVFMSLTSSMRADTRSRRVSSMSSVFAGLRSQARTARGECANVCHTALGEGDFWQIDAYPHSLARYLSSHEDRVSRTFAVICVIEGRAVVSQDGRECSLFSGDFALIDGRAAFTVEMLCDYRKITFVMPRHPVVTRHFDICNRTAMQADLNHAGNRMFRDFLLSIARSVDAMSPSERSALLTTSIEMLGLTELSSSSHLRMTRAQRIVNEIEAGLSDVEMSPTKLAKKLNVSRRQLDLSFEPIGHSVSEHLWERRLIRAATELVLARNTQLKIIDIALSCGFKDAAHFSRVFKKRFGITPRQWRDEDRTLSRAC
jgi:AraC-like DNA-binding protein